MPELYYRKYNEFLNLKDFMRFYNKFFEKRREEKKRK